MRRVSRTLVLAAFLVMAGCSLFRDRHVNPAVVCSFHAPDTVRAGTTFEVTAHVGLGAVSGFVVDHKEIVRAHTYLSLRVWSRDIGGSIRNDQPTEVDITFQTRPTRPGPYRLVAPSPYADWHEVEKIITVLP